MFKFTVSGTGDAYLLEYLYAYFAENCFTLTRWEYCMYEQ